MAFDDVEFERFLSDISDSFMERDSTRWKARILLPFTIVSEPRPTVLETWEQVEINFGHYLIACQAMKLDLIDRTPMSIEHCDDGSVIATYRTEMLSHGMRATDPYVASALLHETPTGWRMSSILNARGHHDWTGAKPKSRGEEPCPISNSSDAPTVLHS